MPFFRRRSQHKNKVPVAVATPVTPTHTTSVTVTVPGYNKGLRDTTKLALLISALLLLCGRSLPSFFISMIACCVIHNGTFASVKNWQWTGACRNLYTHGLFQIVALSFSFSPLFYSWFKQGLFNHARDLILHDPLFIYLISHFIFTSTYYYLRFLWPS